MPGVMPLNLIKLCVGCDTVEELINWHARERGGQPWILRTRQTPKRAVSSCKAWFNGRPHTSQTSRLAACMAPGALSRTPSVTRSAASSSWPASTISWIRPMRRA